MPTPTAVKALALASAALLSAACIDRPPTNEQAATAAPAEVRVDWSACRLPGIALPLEGRLFVVDGGPPPEGAEAGRESIRRVQVLVPGTVSLLLTASDATVWHVQASPQTRVLAVFAGGDAPQRITGPGLADAVLAERSQATGVACGHYLLANGAGTELTEASNQIFGRPYDALYGLRSGQVIIGDPETPPLDAAEQGAATEGG